MVDFSLRIKEEWKGGTVFVAGYCNDVMAYIASVRILREGGYEGESAMVYYGLPSAWAEESEEKGANYYRAERESGEYYRAIAVPEGAKAEAISDGAGGALVIGADQILEFDGKSFTFDDRPYVIMTDHAFVDLGSFR